MLVVVGAGAMTAADMFFAPSAGGESPLATFLVFSGLSLYWNLLTFMVDRRKGGRVAVSLAPASYQALFPIAPSPVVAGVAALCSLTDWLTHRRHVAAGLFNLGSTMLASWCAIQVCSVVRAHFEGLPGLLLGASVGALVCSSLNLFLLLVVLEAAAGRSARETGMLSYAALTNEFIVICFSALMAVTWAVHPLALIAPVVPLTLLFLLLGRLERRERDLRRRQTELQALQELGLQVSARLDVEELGPVVAQIVAEDLRSRGAVLALLDEDDGAFEVSAVFDRNPPTEEPLETLTCEGVDEEFMTRTTPLIGDDPSAYGIPSLSEIGATHFLAQPLSILGTPKGVLVVFDDGSRDPFGAEDANRLSGLLRFVEVALNNARLYDDLRKVQQQMIETEKMSALGQLVSGVAHELNNPLATVMGSSELLSEMQLSPAAKKMTERIRKEADRAARIVRNLLTFSRHHKPEMDWKDLRELIDEIVEMREYDCRVRNIDLKTEYEDPLPLVQIDPYQIHQVLMNLVTNATHAIEDYADSGHIVIRVYRDGQRVRIEVEDDGPGIPESLLAKIFNPFFTTKPVGKGTGLGLSICYGIIQEHQGNFRVTSTPGGGATFILELPLDDAEGTPQPMEPAPAGVGTEDTLAKPAPNSLKVLVVDDEEGIQTVIAEALQVWGHTVVCASSGLAGVDECAKHDFDLIISDLRMPGLDGQGLYQRLHEGEKKPPPIIFSTGDAATPEARVFLDGVHAPVLLKPFTLITLKETIDLALRGHEASALSE